MTDKTRVGIIGCGNISSIYLTNCARFDALEVVAVADLDPSHAKAQAEKFSVPRVLGVEELLKDDQIDIVLNLTVPAAHAEVAMKALSHGKSVYNEKPLALDRTGAAEMRALARANGLRIGCAPDTFLGAGLQTCRKLLDAGAIGRPVAAVAFMLGGGPEGWHPNPFFFYQTGGGPMFDMGPYYLTALTTLLGPVRRVTGSAQITTKQRPIGSEPHKGKLIDVEIPTHIAGILDFASGPVGTLITSFDVPGKNHLPRIEIYGTEGSLLVPDPNSFGGPVLLHRQGEPEWQEIALGAFGYGAFGYGENSRGLGLADMAVAIRCGRAHRANDEIAFHTLVLMHAIHDSSARGTHVELQSTMERPAPMPENLPFGSVPA